jgi:hypothetical protein
MRVQHGHLSAHKRKGEAACLCCSRDGRHVHVLIMLLLAGLGKRARTSCDAWLVQTVIVLCSMLLHDVLHGLHGVSPVLRVHRARQCRIGHEQPVEQKFEV